MDSTKKVKNEGSDAKNKKVNERCTDTYYTQPSQTQASTYFIAVCKLSRPDVTCAA